MPQTRFRATIRLTTLAILTLLLAFTPHLSAQSATRQLPRHRPFGSRSQSGAPAGAPTGLGNNPILLINDPVGIANQYPASINDKGKIVGLVSLPDGSFQGYELQGATFKEIRYPGAASSGAFGINKSGLIIGVYCIDADCNGQTGGFALKGKNFTSIDFPGGMNTGPYGVNASGDIVGEYQTPDSIIHGFMLHKGVYTNIDVPAAWGANENLPFSINKQGTIVGGYGTSDGGGHGFVLQNGTYIQVDYPGAKGTELLGINDSGDIVGSYTDVDDDHSHAFLLSGGVFTPFDVPFPGSISTVLQSINNNHQIVGSFGSYGPEQPDYSFGFLTTY